jgi:hypothetical protein
MAVAFGANVRRYLKRAQHHDVCNAGLPDGIFSNQTSNFGSILYQEKSGNPNVMIHSFLSGNNET